MAIEIQAKGTEEGAAERISRAAYAITRKRTRTNEVYGNEEDATANNAGVDEVAGESIRTLCQAVYKDYRRYRATGARNALSVIALTQGFWASTVFRLSHWAIYRFRIAGLRVIVRAACLLLQKLIEIATGICLPAGCNIGAGLYIGHFGGIFVDSDCRIGENCNLSQGVTIGRGGRGELQGVPKLGDRVHVGANAVILGKIKI